MKRVLLFLFAAVLAANSLRAYDFKSGNLCYNIIRNYEVEVSSVGMDTEHQYSGSIVIPETVTNNGITYAVTRINSYAFDGSYITSVTIPESVTSIGWCAFANCANLQSIVVKEGNSKYDSRDKCNAIIETATNTLIVGSGNTIIPNSVTSIGDDAFKGCTILAYITIPESVTSIGESAFAYTRLSSIIIGNSVTSIGDDAFKGCTSLTSVTIGNSVTSIGSYAFARCSGLTSITIPESVTSIERYVFSGCSSLNSVVWNAKNCTDFNNPFYSGGGGYTAITSQITSFTFGNKVEHIPAYLCKDMSNLTNVIIPDGVTSIGDDAFRGCTSLTSATIGNSVTSIGGSAFYGCTGLTSVTIGNSVTSIGSHAFARCSGLTSITIPESVTSIEHYVFSGCTSLTSVVWNAKNCADFNNNRETPFCLDGGELTAITSQITSFTFGNKVEHIPAYLCKDMSNLTNVIIPDGVTSIGENAFDRCSGLTSITIPESVTSIGYQAFYDCTGLTSVTIGNSVTSIGENAFERCSGLTSITIPETVTSIGDDAFSGCSGLNSIVWNAKKCTDFSDSPFDDFFNDILQISSFTFGNEVEHIPAYLCYNMSNLTSITIPESVTSIGESAFGGCTGLNSIVWDAKNCTDHPRSPAPFSGISLQITSFTFGNKVEHIPAYLCYNMSNLDSVIIPESVTSIGSYALAGTPWYEQQSDGLVYIRTLLYAYKGQMPSNTSISLREGTTHICGSAFNGCTGLTSITIPESVTSIGDNAFNGCTGLTSITIPENVTSIGDNAFMGCTDLTSITIPDGITSIRYRTFGWTGLTSITIPESVTSIENAAFMGCTDLTSIAIPESVTSIGPSVFEDCSSLTSINIPNGVTSIYDWTFKDCSSLTSITIPNSVTSIGYLAFDGCTGLTSITIPESVASIGESAFSSVLNIVYHGIATGLPWGAKNVNGYVDGYLVFDSEAETRLLGCSRRATGNLIIPESVTSIKNYAFYGCSELTSITMEALTPPAAKEILSDSQYSKCTLYVPCGSLAAYQEADGWKEFKDIQEPPVPFSISVKANATQEGTARLESKPTCGNMEAIISATPKMGYRFTHWNDGNTDNPRTFVLTQDTTFTAYFQTVPTHEVTLSCEPKQGTVSGGGTYPKGSEITISATPNEGYGFVRWSDGNTDNPRTLVIEDDLVLTALFQETTALEQPAATTGSSVRKVLRNGQVYILRDGHIYNVLGQEVNN